MIAFRRTAALALLSILGFGPPLVAQGYDPSLFQEMRWRMIGPFRASRTKAGTGVPSQPNVFYIGVVNGGVWKTTDYGRTWDPIFDEQGTGSVGAIAVSLSDPNTVYVGSGEGLQRPDLSTGDGIYKSTDAGKTWTHLGLRDGQQIPQIIVDPRDPNRLFVAVLGHPYGPNAERGIFRSIDGGKSFEKVLYKDENTGGIDVAFDPQNAQTVYAVMWEARQAPWENGVFSGPGSGMFKSTDGGTTWRQIGKGLPTFDRDGLGRIGIGIAPSMPSRVFATVDAARNGGLYRSDDGGENFTRATEDARVVSRASDFAEVKVDPKNPDVVFTASVVAWKSTDGGKTFNALRGAPGGDDYHRFWINPDNPDIILLIADQGAIVTVNGGKTWSSWYNQPTAQMYHVITDNAFPYRVCSGQQESGSACVLSRSDNGRITFMDWHPVSVEEYGYAAPDPLDPDIVYGGKVTRYDRRTGQVQNVAPKLSRTPDYRALRTAPLLFSTVNPRKLFFATNTVWQTTTGGQSWQEISPDLTRRDSVVPPNVGKYGSERGATARHPGVVYTLAPSYVKENVLWAGTDDGLIHVTFNGGRTWKDVTPPALRERPWSKISIMDASHFDTLTAYAAVNTLRLDDMRPHLYRTRDGGKTWTEINRGIAAGAVANSIREDPVRRGLLYAGTETGVYVSFDDGQRWEPLQLNLPRASVRDLAVHGNDLIAATHGRAFWMIDDISVLRQIADSVTSKPIYVFQPAQAVRWVSGGGASLTAGQNPRGGATIDYWFKSTPATKVTLEFRDGTGKVIRTYTSDSTPNDTLKTPADSIARRAREGMRDSVVYEPADSVVSARAGTNRFVWNLRYTGSMQLKYTVIAEGPTDGPVAPPGNYSVRLIAGRDTLVRQFTVVSDPRVKTPPAELVRQFTLATNVRDRINDVVDGATRIEDLQSQLDQRVSQSKPGASGSRVADAVKPLREKLEAIRAELYEVGCHADQCTLDQPVKLYNILITINGQVQTGDYGPTKQHGEMFTDFSGKVGEQLKKLQALEDADLLAINKLLTELQLPVVYVPPRKATTM